MLCKQWVVHELYVAVETVRVASTAKQPELWPQARHCVPGRTLGFQKYERKIIRMKVLRQFL